ncbi:ABC transporter substrate-binding protein [Actinomadura luteofluorescens]|uniref:ABC transporter substrate-binding protein n=1 Tax=Actinomadura luteofluorescens TaxID=46163 RepID=UPI002164279D|nr:ABC transporter substrate-binding protein [Actinomadura glauciflava]MCR3740767.1 peptide/nickel transport system substrate-binding protein [Actinomadura glauciflava]
MPLKDIRRRGTAAAAAALLAAPLAACAGGGSSSAGGSGAYVFALAQDFQGVDRAKYASEASKIVGDVMHSRLLELDTETGRAAGTCAPGVPPKIAADSPLVESWTTADGGKAIEVTLRGGVKSAAGNVLTSDDVKWSIDRLKAIDASAKTLWFTVGGFDPDDTISVESPTKFTLHLKSPSELAAYTLAGNAALILDSKDAKAHATPDDPWATKYLTDHTADFGPWKLTAFSPQQLTFDQNPNYAGERGNVKRVVLRSVPEASSRIQLVQTGQAAETSGLDYTQLESLKKSGAVKLVECGNPGRDWLGLNTEDPVLGKPEVRQAISMALDRSAIATAVYRGFATPAQGGLSKAYGEFGDGAGYRHDVAGAKKLLGQAGVGGGFSFTLSVSSAQPGAHAQNLAVLVQQQLKAVGIDVKIKNVPSAVQYKADGLAGKMQAFLMAESPAVGNPGYSAWLSLGKNGLQNYGKFDEPRLDALAADLQAGPGGETKAKTAELAGLIAERQPAVYLVDRSTVNVRNTCVTDLPSTGFGNDFTRAKASCQ